MSGSKLIRFDDAVLRRWDSLKSSVSDAARPYTSSGSFPISPFYMHDIIGGQDNIDRALKSVGRDMPGRDLRASVIIGNGGIPMIEVMWS